LHLTTAIAFALTLLLLLSLTVLVPVSSSLLFLRLQHPEHSAQPTDRGG
jgi:hypothetical protein